MSVFDVLREKLDKKKVYFQKFYEAEGKTKADADLNKATQLAFDDAIEIINKAEQEYNDGWIPCSERLPDKEEFLRNDGRFIVTDGNRRYQSIYDIYQGGFRTLVLFTNGGIERGWNFEVDNCVIAWQPLPAPYKPKGE